MKLSAPHIQLLEAILGVQAPWTIEAAELNLADARLHVWIGHDCSATWSCPDCAAALPCDSHEHERVWRHLDLCQFQTRMHARLPRVVCPRHAVREVDVPWGTAANPYTSAMERWIFELTDNGGVNGASSALDVPWTDALRMMLSRRMGV